MRFLLPLLALSACTTPQPGISGPDSEESGELQLAVTRAANSQVPPQADSAVIRIWHPMAGTNLLQRVAIPNPGDTTRVRIRAPARAGYSVGVMAYRGFDGSTSAYRLALVGGRAANVTIATDQPARVHIALSRWNLVLAVPDSVVPGEPTTLGGRVTGGPGFFGGGSMCLAFSPWTTPTEFPNRGCAYPLPQMLMVTSDSFTTTFTAPAATADTTLWFAVDFWVDTQPWQTGGLDYVFLPSLMLGDTLFHVPVRVSGEIIVSFTPKR